MGESSELTLWDVMEPSTSEDDWINLIFEDFPENTNAMFIVSACENL
jgi:hypothetical protein